MILILNYRILIRKKRKRIRFSGKISSILNSTDRFKISRYHRNKSFMITTVQSVKLNMLLIVLGNLKCLCGYCLYVTAI